MRFFVSKNLNTGQTVQLPDDVYHHWCKVLRAGIGDTATLFNGQGGEYLATLTHIDKKSAAVTLGTFNPINRALPYRITLAQAISKGERMDYTVQKCCELGVSVIQPIISQRSERLRYERDQKKLTHWQHIANSACEQCGLNIIPQILPPITLTEYLTVCRDELKIVLALSDKTHRYQYTTALPKTITILVGAEGGLSDDEIDLCHQHGFLSWTLGERILRTETAGVVAMASLQTLHTLQNSLPQQVI